MDALHRRCSVDVTKIGFAMGLSSHDAGDLCCDVLLTVIETGAQSEITTPAALDAYVRGVALKKMDNARAKAARRKTDYDTDRVERTTSATHNPESRALGKHLLTNFHKCLHKLSTPRYQEILIRHFVWGFRAAEDAKHFGVSHAHYHRLLYKAKQRFIQVARDSGLLADFEEWTKQ